MREEDDAPSHVTELDDVVEAMLRAACGVRGRVSITAQRRPISAEKCRRDAGARPAPRVSSSRTSSSSSAELSDSAPLSIIKTRHGRSRGTTVVRHSQTRRRSRTRAKLSCEDLLTRH